jgi:pimeloyl-ACP methyl ester carboxylesterase
VVPALEAAGHTAEAFDLPDDGGMEGYVARAGGVLHSRSEPAVLVGHSLGGMVITEAAARCPERVASLVYVCAFLPGDGQSLADLIGMPPTDSSVTDMPPEAAIEIVYGCCDRDIAEAAVARRRPQPTAPFYEPVSAAPDDLPRHYVVCSRDKRIPPDLQRRMAAERATGEVVEIDTDHSPFFSATDELAGHLNRWAALSPQ